MNNLLTRTISGVVYVLMISVSIIAGPYSFIALFSIVTGLCLWEFYELIEKNTDVSISKWPATIGGVYLFISGNLFSAGILSFKYIFLWFAVIILIYITELYSKKSKALYSLAFTILGQIYVALPLTFLGKLGYENGVEGIGGYSPLFLMSFFALIWICDTGAYLVGSTLGKHKMFERISPKKSWEGFFGGLLLTLAGSYVISLLFPGFLTLVQWFVFSLIIVAFGTWGDLTESMIKRNLKVKDSGKMIPGHGGILDRLDSCLMAAPAVVIYLMFI